MGNNLVPLYYAILKLFLDNEKRCAQDVIDALEPDYGGYKLLIPKDVEEALATAKENGLLDEVDCDIDANGTLLINYRINSFGEDMISRYIG